MTNAYTQVNEWGFALHNVCYVPKLDFVWGRFLNYVVKIQAKGRRIHGLLRAPFGQSFRRSSFSAVSVCFVHASH